MCGIAGLFRVEGSVAPTDTFAVHRMLDVQASRGPDGAYVHQVDGVVLGHRRLAILDLSDAARQPMRDERGDVWLTYNGEIYNFVELRSELERLGHRFRSRGDSEVIVHGYEAWGAEGLLPRLRGMFAFALYDRRQARLVLARDRIGIKPLYYVRSDGDRSVGFASEVRALVEAGVAPADRDPSALIGFLCLGTVPAPRTIVQAVRSLPPGHYLTAERAGVALHRYWTPPPPEGEVDTTGLEQVLEDAVRRHLVSDVPVGVFLSGGVDSAGLVAVATRLGSARLHTLTVTFGERGFDEGDEARRLAEAFGTAHDAILVEAGDFVRELPAFFEAMDQPTHDGVNTYFIARAARKAGLTVVLSGVGGDELFWGYPHHRRLAAAQGALAMLARLPRGLRRGLTRVAGGVAEATGREAWGRVASLGDAVSPAGLYFLVRGFFSPRHVARLVGATVSEVEAILDDILGARGADVALGRTMGEAVNRLELGRYLHDQLLRDTDVFGMAHSVEIRVPYLDDPLLERAVSLSGSIKLDPVVNKPLLCRAVGHPLVREVAAAPKRGFSFPMAVWLRRHAGELAPLAARAPGVEPSVARHLWRAFETGRLHWSRAWALVVLGASRLAGGHP